MDISFVARQQTKKGYDILKLALWRIIFRGMRDQTIKKDEKLRQPSMFIQTQSQFVKQKEDSTIQNDDLQTSRPKVPTVYQGKTRSSQLTQSQYSDNRQDNDSSAQQELPPTIQEEKEENPKQYSKTYFEESKEKAHRQVEHQSIKFGDVFVLKCNVQYVTSSFHMRTNQSDVNEMIMIGNLQYQSSINAVNLANQLQNNPTALQQKCYFRIVNPRTIQNDKNFVNYGQRIIIQHVRSEQYLQVNLDAPALERGSFSVRLSPQQNHYSMLRILPVSNSKKIGDQIYYNEPIILQEDCSRQYYIKIETDDNKISKPYDINAGDSFDTFYINKVPNHQNNIVQIMHLETQNVINLNERQYSQYIYNRACFLGQGEEKSQEQFTLRILDYHKFLTQEIDVIITKSSSTINSNSLFEIQPINPFTDIPNSQYACRLKALFNQQYLCLDPNDDKRFKLTYNTKEPSTIFYMVPEQQSCDELITSIQSEQDTYLNLKNGKLLFERQKNEENPQMFQIKILQKSQAKIIDDFNEIQQGFINFQLFLQQWGTISDKRKQNEEVLILDYIKALQQKTQLETEISYFENYLQTLYQQLTPKPYVYTQQEQEESEITIIQKQQIIREQKILDILFSILKLIDSLTYTNTKSQKDKDKSRLHKQLRQLPSQQSASHLAMKTLNIIPVLIYKVLYKAIKNNSANRKIVLDNDEFLCQQIRLYGSKVAKLLKESMIESQNVELSDWVKLLEPLDESNNNIYDMTVFLRIIAIALVDSNQQGIVRNQNRVCKELFSQGRNGKTKYLLQFSSIFDQPTFNLYKEDSIAEFLIKNPSLSALRLIKNPEVNEDMFSLEELGERTQAKKSLSVYVSYITAAVNVLAELCRGRNKKSIKKILFQGITTLHIVQVIKNPQIPLSMKNSYIKLYEVIFVDIDPFLQLGPQLNFIWSQLQYDPEIKMIQIFNHYIEPAESGKLTKEFDDRMFPLILELLVTGDCLQEGLVKLKKRRITFKLNSLQNSQILQEKEGKSKNLQKVKFLTSLFHLIYKVIQLGYLSEEQICTLIKPVLQIFLPFMQQKEKSNLNAKENWLSDLVLATIKEIQQEGFIDSIDNMYYTAGLVIKQYFETQINLQIWEFVAHFQKSYKSYCLQSLDQLKDEVKIVLDKLTIGNSQQYVQNFVLSIYLSNWPKSLRGFKQCKEALQIGLNQGWIQRLKQVEIINDSELELYMQLTGNSLVGQIFSPVRLQTQIMQLEEDLQRKKDEIKGKDEKTLEIDNQLNKLINRIKEMKMDKFQLQTTQNILRNLQVHKLIMRIFKTKDQGKSETQKEVTISIAIKFLSLFVSNNPINTEEIKDNFSELLSLSTQNFKVCKLLGVFCRSLEKQNINTLQVYYRQIFKVMGQSRQACQQLYQTLTAILQFSQKPEKASVIKRDYMSNMFKTPSFIQDLQYYRQFFELKNKKEEQQFYQGDFKRFQAATQLTQQVIQEYPLGISQVSNILLFEQINSIFYNPGTPFLLKSELIKLLYPTQIYNNQAYTLNDMRDLLILVTNEVLFFPRYLDGILKSYQAKNEDERVLMIQDRQLMENMRKEMFYEFDEKKKNMIATTPGLQSTQNAAQQQAAQMNESRRVVQDNTEYWKYIYLYSNWKKVEYGLINFITQLFIEIKNRRWNVHENQASMQQIIQTDQLNQQNDDSLFEPIAILKLSLELMKQSLIFLKNIFQYHKYNIYITKLQYQLSQCLLNCPIHQNLKNIKINRLTMEYKTLRQYKAQLKEFKQKEQKVVPNEELKGQMSQFYEKLRLQMLQKHFNVMQLMEYLKGHFQFDSEILKENNQYFVDSPEKCVAKDQFCKLFSHIFDEHLDIILQYQSTPQKQITEKQTQDYQNTISYEDAVKFYEDYVQLKDSNKNYIDINKFYARLQDYIDSKKIAYDKQQLKKDQMKKIFEKQQLEESIFIKQSFQKFLHQYDLLINPINANNFYRLDKENLIAVSEQLSIKLGCQDNLNNAFNIQLLDEVKRLEYLAISLLQSLLERQHENVPKLQEFCFKLIPSVLLYFQSYQSEVDLNEVKTSTQLIDILINIQTLDQNQFIKVYLNENQAHLIKFIQKVFHYIDRLFSLGQTQKDYTNYSDKNQYFFTKSTGFSERNSLLQSLLKLVQSILKFLGKLFTNLEVHQFYDQANKTTLIVEEVLYFTSNFFQYINRLQLTRVSSDCDILIIYTQCLNCLNSFCYGSIQNQTMILNYKPLIPLLQQVIVTKKYDLLSNNLSDQYYRKLFQTVLQLLLQIKIDSQQIYADLSFQLLFEKLIRIYETLQDRQNIIIQGQQCNHKSVNCTYMQCAENQLAQGENELFKICFDIMIFFNILNDHQQELLMQEKKKDYWKSIKGANQSEYSQVQKRNINFIALFNNLVQFVKTNNLNQQGEEQLNEYLITNNQIINCLEIIEKKTNQKMNLRKLQHKNSLVSSRQDTNQNLANYQSPKNKFKESIYKITGKNKHHVQQILDEMVPFKKFEESTDQQIESNVRQIKMGAKINDAVINWYEDTQEHTHIDAKKRQLCIKMAQAINFFSQFIGQIEIVQDQLITFYFPLPFSYLFFQSSTTKQAKKLKGNAQHQSFQLMSDYFQQEVLFRQKISQRNLINQFSLNLEKFKIINYGLVITINILYLSSLRNDGSSVQNDYQIIQIIALVLTIILSINAFFTLGFTIFNSHPYIMFKFHYFKNHLMQTQQIGLDNQEIRESLILRQRRKKRIQSLLHRNLIIAHVFNFETIYYFIYFVISLVSITVIPFMSLLLFDLIKRSKSLGLLLLAVSRNLHRIIYILLITLFVVYCYSFMAINLITENNILVQYDSNYFYILFFLMFEHALRLNQIVVEYSDNDEDLNKSQFNWGLYAFSLSLYVIVLLIFYCLLVGVISSTIQELKSLRKSIRSAKCYVCNITYEQCKLLNQNWDNHIKKQHPLPQYLFFINYIQQKPDSQCNQIERDIKHKLKYKDISWIPQY